MYEESVLVLHDHCTPALGMPAEASLCLWVRVDAGPVVDCLWPWCDALLMLIATVLQAVCVQTAKHLAL